MAYWTRRRTGYVYVYTRVDGRPKCLPRADIKHLDGQTDHSIQAWVDQWSSQWESSKITPDQIQWSDSYIEGLLSNYAVHMSSSGRSEITIQQHTSALRRFVVPFYLELSLTDPRQWVGVSSRMTEHLLALEVTPPVINVCNFSLRGFWRYLFEERVVFERELILRTPQGVRSEVTPLKYTLTPDEVLAFVRTCSDSQVRLMALVGYFHSLRSQELFALKKTDFRTGPKLVSLEAIKAFERAGLYTRLVVRIERQRTNSGKPKKPKANSIGWVGCFNEEAARLIVGELNELDEEDLIRQKNRETYRLWERIGIPDITLKDLRRASLYWLSHNTSLLPAQLMHHSRHRSIESLNEYLRRPDEEFEDYKELKLD